MENNVVKIVISSVIIFIVFLYGFNARAMSVEKIIALTNEERAKNNLPPLIERKRLDNSARAKADDCIKYNYFAHTSPDGVDPWFFFDTYGYGRFIYAGENLAYVFPTEKAVVRAWMNSPEHRKNILNKKYTDIGVGINGGVIVQHLGTER